MARRTSDSGSSRPSSHETVGHDKAVHDTRHETHDTRGRDTYDSRDTQATGPTAYAGHHEAADRFGGINWGAAFFGWLVAVGLTILLTGIIGAIASAVSSSTQVTQSQAERQAGTIGIVAGIVLLVVLALSYYAGGYVAGRMSRFDGVKQGLATWLIGLLVTLLAIGLGALFGSQYNIMERVNLPTIPLSTSALSTGGIITAIAVLVVSLLAAMLGGKVGQRYHNKVDRVAHR